MNNLLEFQNRVDEQTDNLVQSIIDIFYQYQGRALSFSFLSHTLAEKEQITGGYASAIILQAQGRGIVTIDTSIHLTKPFRINLLPEDEVKMNQLETVRSAINVLNELRETTTPGDWRVTECLPAKPGVYGVGVGVIDRNPTAPRDFVTSWGVFEKDAQLMSMLQTSLPLLVTILQSELEEMEEEGRPPYNDVFALAEHVVSFKGDDE